VLPVGARRPIEARFPAVLDSRAVVRTTVTNQINKFKRLGLLRREGRLFVVNTHLLMTFLDPEEA
jgi:hypothetical protein